MIIDKLYESVQKNGHVCLGLDTSMEYIPTSFLKQFASIEEALFNFNKRIIDATYDSVACFKVQIAYYEAYGIQGLCAYKNTLAYIRKLGVPVIADIKRGDIANTAEMYAKAHFEGDFESDFITLSPYMGLDSIDPYLSYIKDKEKGVFLLVRTSNKGAEDIQYLDSNGEKIYNIVGRKLQNLGNQYLGDCGYSSIGGVVGCTHIEEGIELRKNLNKMFFLIPGYGAQGGGAKEVAIYLQNGNGGVVNASRSILLAYKKQQGEPEKFDQYARMETLRMKKDIAEAVK